MKHKAFHAALYKKYFCHLYLGTVNETDCYCIYTVPHSQLLQPLTVLLHLEQVEQISNVQLGWYGFLQKKENITNNINARIGHGIVKWDTVLRGFVVGRYSYACEWYISINVSISFNVPSENNVLQKLSTSKFKVWVPFQNVSQAKSFLIFSKMNLVSSK